jgi:hypothetical protein
LSLFKSRYLSKYEQYLILCTPNYCRESWYTGTNHITCT